MRFKRADWIPLTFARKPVPRNPKTLGEHLFRRRAQLGQDHRKTARILGISTVTLSRWELDKVHPTWEYHQPLIDYLGYDPWQYLDLRDPYGNESRNVAFFRSDWSRIIGETLRTERLRRKLTVAQCAEAIGVSSRTLRDWEAGLHHPIASLRGNVVAFLGYDPWKEF